MEEERRLAFVALTRAERGLYLSEADGRNFDGSPRYPSRFLLDVGEDLLSFTHPPEEGLLREARDYVDRSGIYLTDDRQGETFSLGDQVRHPVFGPGTVLEADSGGGAYLIRFEQMETPRKISFRAKLEPVR